MGEFNIFDIVGNVYDLILYPFLKIFYYIAMGSLFVILILRVFSFVSDSGDDVKKHTGNIIVSLVVGLLVIIASKQLVEGVYGREEDIRNGDIVRVSQV